MIFLPFIIEVILLNNRYGDFCYKNMEHFSEKLLKPILYRPKSEEKKIEEGGSGRVKLGWRRLFIPRNI